MRKCRRVFPLSFIQIIVCTSGGSEEGDQGGGDWVIGDLGVGNRDFGNQGTGRSNKAIIETPSEIEFGGLFL